MTKGRGKESVCGSMCHGVPEGRTLPKRPQGGRRKTPSTDKEGLISGRTGDLWTSRGPRGSKEICSSIEFVTRRSSPKKGGVLCIRGPTHRLDGEVRFWVRTTELCFWCETVICRRVSMLCRWGTRSKI